MRSPDGELEGFDSWYEAYPRKKAPGDAQKAWRQTAAERPPVATMLAALQRQIAEWKQQGRPIDRVSYPASYLRGKEWADEPDKPLAATTPYRRLG